jgi:phosphoribosylformylglycinamidine synthase
VPVVGGNVSLYNESGGGPIYPTPVVGMVGELPDPARAGRSGFARAGDTIGLAGPFVPQVAGSELAKLRGDELPSGLPEVDVAAVRAAHAAIRDAVRAGELSSAHDIAEGGPLVALAESCLAGGLGATVELGALDDDLREPMLFGEAPGRGFIVSGSPEALVRLGERTAVHVLGTTGGDALDVSAAELRVCLTLAELRAAHAALAPLFD